MPKDKYVRVAILKGVANTLQYSSTYKTVLLNIGHKTTIEDEAEAEPDAYKQQHAIANFNYTKSFWNNNSKQNSEYWIMYSRCEDITEQPRQRKQVSPPTRTMPHFCGIVEYLLRGLYAVRTCIIELVQLAK